MIRRITAAVMALIMLLGCASGALAAGTQPADFLDVTQSGGYFKLDNTLIRVDGDVAAKVAEGSIVSVATIGDIAYCLQYGDDYALDLVQYAPGSDAKVLYEFQASDRVSSLTVQGEEMFLLLNDLLHVFYPSNGMCLKLANTAMAEYVWLDGMIYFVSREEVVTNRMDSLLGKNPVVKDGGVLYSLEMNTGAMVRLLETGVEDLRVGGGKLYFHDLSDAYVMGTAEDEWLEGRVYSYDPATAQRVRVVEGYDWGFYPLNDAVALYTAEGVSLLYADGTSQLLLQPQGAIHAVAADGNLYVFDQTANVLYCYDGNLRVMAQESLGALLTGMGRAVQDVTIEFTGAPAGEEPGAAANTVEFAQDDAQVTENPSSEPGAAQEENPAVTPEAQPTEAPAATPTAQPTATPKPTATPTAKPDSLLDDGYIFPDSDKRKLTKEEIKAVDKSLWPYARNEIYARHGYDFSNTKYEEYFDSKSWYWAGGFSTGDLNSIEWYNMQLLKEMEGLTGTSSSGSSSSGNSSGSTSSGYIFANSSKKKLTREQILSIDKDMWPYARNEIYARHGYSFKTAKFRNYFKKKSWYKEGGFSTDDLNSIEWYNMELIRDMEKEYGVK